MVEDVDVFGLEVDAADVGVCASRSQWAQIAAQACVEERARIVQAGIVSDAQPQKLSRQLDKVDERVCRGNLRRSLIGHS